jgi:hypothetical protein
MNQKQHDCKHGELQAWKVHAAYQPMRIAPQGQQGHRYEHGGRDAKDDEAQAGPPRPMKRLQCAIACISE